MWLDILATSPTENPPRVISSPKVMFFGKKKRCQQVAFFFLWIYSKTGACLVKKHLPPKRVRPHTVYIGVSWKETIFRWLVATWNGMFEAGHIGLGKCSHLMGHILVDKQWKRLLWNLKLLLSSPLNPDWLSAKSCAGGGVEWMSTGLVP